MGFADLSRMLHTRFNSFNYGITIGKKLDDGTMDSVVERPNIQYYKLYENSNAYLLNLANAIAGKISLIGINNLVVMPTSSQKIDRARDYYKTLRHYFSHKMVGTREGLDG